ncbi:MULTISPECIES: hypothetical protein [unclassified Nocardia]|uniref:hypothetical protein n=1 Tax=unclassified Nocardia TaxID=2637762 RepID=UPI001CE418D6|nr:MULTISPECIES: hypothetical protein [unclassified Nocardia]
MREPNALSDEHREAFWRSCGWSPDLPEEQRRAIENDWDDESIEAAEALGWNCGAEWMDHTTNRRQRTIVASQVDPILNYFGKCPVCGYPARASTINVQFDDGSSAALVVATCGLPCGWNGPVVPSTMT